MNGMGRTVRSFAASLLMLAACGTVAAQDDEPTPGVRLRWQDFATDSARVASLARGVGVMKSRDNAPRDSAEYRTSWQYWSAMHSYYGPESAQGGPIQNAIARAPARFQVFFAGLTNQVPPAEPPGLGEEVWDACQHGTEHFLTWHRMYLFYFERVLRAAAGDDTLRLPYWDYTDPAQVDFPAALGQLTLDGELNPLFDVRRTSQAVRLDPRLTDIDDLLSLPFSDFQGTLEFQPHGTVHCAVGNGCASPLMGKIPAAATDMVFWLHHANLDRIWQCWLNRGGKVPDDDEFQDQTFAFVDENGDRAELAVRDLFRPDGPIDVTYDHVSNCSRRPEPPPVPIPAGGAVEAAPPMALVSSVPAFKIDKPAMSVTVKLPKTGPQARALGSAMGAGAPKTARVELVLVGIETDAAPGVLFNVFLATPGLEPKRQYVGTLSFFGMEGESGHAHGGRRATFDVTEEAQALAEPGVPVEALKVEFEATTGLADGTMEEAASRFNAEAGVRVASIELRVGGTGQ